MAKAKKATRDEIRARIFSTDMFKREEIEAFGTTIEIRQTTLGRVLELQGKLEKDRTTAIGLSFLEFCYVPGTDERLFDEDDLDGILALPFGKDFQGVQDVINKLMGVTEKQIQDAEGNLGATPGDTTSS